jgi:hypothetical protein
MIVSLQVPGRRTIRANAFQERAAVISPGELERHNQGVAV